MTSSIPYLTAENEKANNIVHLLMVNNNHFNTLIVINKSKFSHFQKVKKDKKKKCESIVTKQEKDHSFMGDYSIVYS